MVSLSAGKPFARNVKLLPVISIFATVNAPTTMSRSRLCCPLTPRAYRFLFHSRSCLSPFFRASNSLFHAPSAMLFCLAGRLIPLACSWKGRFPGCETFLFQPTSLSLLVHHRTLSCTIHLLASHWYTRRHSYVPTSRSTPIGTREYVPLYQTLFCALLVQ